MRLRRLTLALALVGLGLAPTVAAKAQSVRVLGDFRDWSAYAAKDGTGQICFAVSKPTEVSPKPDGYSQGYLYLTDRPAANTSNELNLVAGFTFAPDSAATLTIGGNSFDLFTQADAAWLKDTTKAQTVAGYMRAGASLTVDAVTDKGIKVTETFSLSGVTAASKAVATACQ